MSVIKQQSESLIVNFSFKKSMISTESITSVDSMQSLPNDLIFGTTTINTNTVDVLISGGTPDDRPDTEGAEYKATMLVTTDRGQVLEKDLTITLMET